MAGDLDAITKIKNEAINGPAGEVSMSVQVRDDYVKAIHDFRDVVQTQIDKVKALPGYGPAGGFHSALQAQQNLQKGLDDFEKYMGEYVKYLDALADTVTAAANRFLHLG